MTQQSADLGQAPVEPPEYRDCPHDVFSIIEPFALDAARPEANVQCSECGELGDATLTVDWS